TGYQKTRLRHPASSSSPLGADLPAAIRNVPVTQRFLRRGVFPPLLLRLLQRSHGPRRKLRPASEIAHRDLKVRRSGAAPSLVASRGQARRDDLQKYFSKQYHPKEGRVHAVYRKAGVVFGGFR